MDDDAINIVFKTTVYQVRKYLKILFLTVAYFVSLLQLLIVFFKAVLIFSKTSFTGISHLYKAFFFISIRITDSFYMREL